MVNDKPIGYCDLHEEEVYEGEFEWKGCWNCWHFAYSNFPYLDVYEAAKALKKSPSTIRSWLNEGRLSGKLFKRGRYNPQLGAWRKWFVDKTQPNGIWNVE